MLVAFDLDDTLYHERDFVHSGRMAVAAAMAGMPTFDIDGPWSPDLLAVYRSHIPDIALSADAALALELLRARGITMAIVTDGRSVTQRHKFEALGLDRFVDPANLLISEEVGSDKTSGDAFRLLMRRYPHEGHYLYVGDNPAKDFVAPNRLGWLTVMLVDSQRLNVHPQLLSPDPTYRPRLAIDSLTHFARAIPL